MKNNYWENETPVEVDTGKNILKYFKQAGKLQISMPYWEDDAGERRQGKTVTLDLTALRGSAAGLEVVRGIMGGES